MPSKKKRIEINVVADDSESQGKVNYMQQGHNRQGGYEGYNNTIKAILNKPPLGKTPLEEMMESFISKTESRFGAYDHE